VLLDRAIQRSRTLAVQSTIRQAGDVEERSTIPDPSNARNRLGLANV
jgi:hypothetical protein